MQRVPLETRSERISYVLLLATWIGLITGIGEVIILILTKLSGEWVHLSLDTIWMAPITDAVLFCLVGLVLFVFLSRTTKRGFQRPLIIILLVLSFLSWIYLIPKLNRYAVWLLAIGLGVQATRLALGRSIDFYWFVRRTFVVPVIIVIISFLSLYGWRYASEKRAMAAIPKTNQDLPNILLIVMDTVRSQNLSLYGYELEDTPFLEKLAARSTVFRNAITPGSWTYPSHASMFTGLSPYQIQIQNRWDVPLNPSLPTLAGYLSSQGYITAGFSANQEIVGWEYGLTRGFAHFEDFPVSLGQFLVSSTLLRRLECHLNRGEGCWLLKEMLLTRPVGSKPAAEVNHEFTRYLSHHKQGPFFVFLNYFDAHEPHIPPRPYDRLYGFQRINIPGVTVSNNPEEREKENMANWIKGYDGGIANIDNQLNRLFEQLNSSGFLDNALVIITSDHGQEFMEHGMFGHGDNLYTTVLHVPLLIYDTRAGASSEGIWVNEPVTLQDLPATIIDYIGINKGSPFPGVSLLNFLHSSSTLGRSYRDKVISDRVNFADNDLNQISIIEDNFRYNFWWSGREELYSLDDVWEKNNLINNPSFSAVVLKFRSTLHNYPPFASNP